MKQELVEDEHLIEVREQFARVQRLFFVHFELVLLVEALSVVLESITFSFSYTSSLGFYIRLFSLSLSLFLFIYHKYFLVSISIYI